MFARLLVVAASLVSAQDTVGSSGCTASSCVFANSYLKFGTGTETSVNNWGLFQQPWYFSRITSAWYKLTYAGYPLDTAIGTGIGSPNWSGATVVDLYSLTSTASTTDYSGFVVDSSDTTKTVGHGVITSFRVFTISGQRVTFQNTFSLGQNDSFVKIITRVINNSTATLQNVMVWTGTRDDYVGSTDVNIKTRGNLNTGNFTAITANNQSSHAIMITNPTEGVLFYSETPGVMTSYASCCSFSNAYNTYPLTLAPSTPSATDGSYAAVLPIGNITVNSSGSIIWYYAAGAISSLNSVAQTVAAAQVADVGIISIPSDTSTQTQTPTLTTTPTTTLTTTPTTTPTTTQTTTPTTTQTPTQTPTQTTTQTQTPSSTSTSPIRVIIATDTRNMTITEIFAPIINIIESTKTDNSPLIYTFISINIILILCCFIGLLFAVWKYRRQPVQETDKKPEKPEKPAWGIIEQLRSVDDEAPTPLSAVPTTTNKPQIKIRIPGKSK